MQNSLIEIEHLTKKWGYRKILDDLSFQAKAGEVIVIMGENGAGKTTFFRILASLNSYSFGSIKIMDYSMPNEMQKVKSQIGFLFHETMLYNDLTVYENLWMFGKLYNIKVLKSRIEELISMLGLELYIYEAAKVLSKGLLQRLAFCRLLLHQPQIMIMDEPFSGLDIESRKIIQKLLLLAKAEGKVSILATHDFHNVASLGTRFDVLHKGKLTTGNPNNLNMFS